MSTASGIRSVSPWRLLGGFLLLAAVTCGVIAAVTWQDAPVEGAYLNRSLGATVYSGVFSQSKYDAARILLGAAIALGVSSLLVLATSIIQSRNRAPAPQAPAADRAP